MSNPTTCPATIRQTVAGRKAKSKMSIALLGLPKGSSIVINGEMLVLKRDDFVGISHVPQPSKLHVVTSKAAVSKNPQSAPFSVTVGFAMLPGGMPLIRRFDPTTEEVSSEPVSEPNLVDDLQNNRIPAPRVVPYESVISKENKLKWDTQTEYVSMELCSDRKLTDGCKIVPGSYCGEVEQSMSNNDGVQSPGKSKSEEIIDGVSVEYPDVPVFEPQSPKSGSNPSSFRRWQAIRHAGTRRYLSKLPPSNRTEIFMHPASTAPEYVLTDVLRRYYHGSWKNLLGDLQLAYLLFLQIQCLSSLEHWRDLVAMLSVVGPNGVSQNSELYLSLVRILTTQIVTIEREFIEDMEMSQGTFLVSALARICTHAKSTTIENLISAAQDFQRLLVNRFPNTFTEEDFDRSADLFSKDLKLNSMGRIRGRNDSDVFEESDDEDPVVVDQSDVEASLARSRVSHVRGAVHVPPHVRDEYPLLVGAMAPQEDIVMACARILDDASDVSLVREAAGYLEAVEQKNRALNQIM